MTQQRADYPLDYTKGPNGTAEAGMQGSASAVDDRLKSAAQSAEEIAAKVAEQAREYGEKAQEAARNFKPYVERSMKEQPVATLAVASAIGFVLGALWKK